MQIRNTAARGDMQAPPTAAAPFKIPADRQAAGRGENAADVLAAKLVSSEADVRAALPQNPHLLEAFDKLVGAAKIYRQAPTPEGRKALEKLNRKFLAFASTARF